MIIIILFAHIHWKLSIQFDRYRHISYRLVPSTWWLLIPCSKTICIIRLTVYEIRNRSNERFALHICTHFLILDLFDAKKIDFGQPQRNPSSDSTVFLMGRKRIFFLMTISTISNSHRINFIYKLCTQCKDLKFHYYYYCSLGCANQLFDE